MPETSNEAVFQLVELTDKAREKVNALMAEDADAKGKGLRLGVKGGGCSGFSYNTMFDDKKDNDYVMTFDGFDVYIDPKSAIYLKGIVLDYQGGLGGKGFVFSNPNATNTCGCGESFSV